ncbi:MAG: excinuclease ABC subunit UvrC [Thermodesulfobacteriota bacterium]|nr:excinuclease ABC subunit UvrC [Thermodesulfobacteriota bacterium]
MIDSKIIKDIPHKPGVYIFKNKSEKIIYIGKAKDLSKRIRSYLGKGKSKNFKASIILKNAHDIAHIITGTEKEALILEGNLIKKHRPRYNVILKDDANYPFLKLDTYSKYPRLTIVRRIKKDGGLYFGPFTSSSSVRSTMRLIGPIFPLRKCSTRDVPKRSRPCLNYQLGRCLAPCCIKVDNNEYQEIVEQVKLFLGGRNKELISRLKEVMLKAAKEQNFEKAAKVRDQIKAVEKTLEHQTVVSTKMTYQDVIGLSSCDKVAAIVILFIREGYMVGSRNYFIPCEWVSSYELMEAFLKQYYRGKEFIPPDIILCNSIEDKNLISHWLTGIAGKKITLSVPSRGEKKRLANMAAINAEDTLKERQKNNQSAILDVAKSVLNLKRKPIHIEGIDISNLKGEFPVASLVSFVNGLPEKSGYRNYRIREVDGINDYAMIKETVDRRLKTKQLPDLFVIDGGKGHLFIALKSIGSCGLKEPPDVISIAKAKHGKDEIVDKIYLANRKNPVIFPRNHPVLAMLMHLRDETHRRAIGYYRKRKNQSLTVSVLDNIQGVGPKRKNALFNYFRDIHAIAKSDIAGLKKVPHINRAVAKDIFDYFNNEPLVIEKNGDSKG